MRSIRTFALVVLGVAVAGCEGAGGGEEAAPVDPAAAEAEAVALAAALYDPATFDTVAWQSDSAAVERGALVYRAGCEQCHGAGGKGDGGFVLNGDTIHPPSFVVEDWRFAEDPEGLWRKVWVGNARGMPHWGTQGLLPRDIVAVERYIRLELRGGV